MRAYKNELPAITPLVSVPVAQLSADHLCMLLGPVVVTHRPPVPVVEDLHPPLPRGVSSHQPHHTIWNSFSVAIKKSSAKHWSAPLHGHKTIIDATFTFNNRGSFPY